MTESQSSKNESEKRRTERATRRQEEVIRDTGSDKRHRKWRGAERLTCFRAWCRWAPWFRLGSRTDAGYCLRGEAQKPGQQPGREPDGNQTPQHADNKTGDGTQTPRRWSRARSKHGAEFSSDSGTRWDPNSNMNRLTVNSRAARVTAVISPLLFI